MIPRLVAVSGPLEGRTFQLGKDRFVIGRQDGCDLQLPNLEISRRHCEIVRDEAGRWVLRDLGSRRGTSVNGRSVRHKDLEHTDLITLGTNVLLFLRDASSGDAEPPPEDGSPGVSGTAARKPTESLHLDPTRIEDALPTQARLARELSTLLRLALDLRQSDELETLAERLLDAALAALPAQRGAVLLREPGLEQPVELAKRGEWRRFSRTVVDRVLAEGVVLCCPRGSDDDALSDVASVNGVGSLLAAPLTDSAGESLGLLYLDSRSAGFAEHHLELVGALTAVASLAFQNALHLRWLRRENQRLRDEQAAAHDMLGESAVMRRVFDLVARVSRTDSTVLIAGESGTGKELAAHAIHRSSQRSEGPFVVVNCATLSENLLASELFGHERGAFTGATSRKVGKMEVAHRGTLFLDEVAEIPVTLQAKLLRALQEREIERVGGLAPISVDVRVLAASHRDLRQAVADGAFREDLFFRLNVITCELPPLRDRREDIPLLVSHFSRLHGRKLGLPQLAVTPPARECLLAYDWPGNVRELANVVERAVVLGDGELIRREDLPEEVIAAAVTDGDGDPTPAGDDFQLALKVFKKQVILDAWRQSGQDYARTAEHLGIHVNSLHRIVRDLGLKAALGR